MRPIIIMACAAILTLGATAGLAADPEHHAPEIKDARFGFLKQLIGTWSSESNMEEMAGGNYEFRLTAGGTAIEEREMIGTPMEMLTVYHMDDGKLVGTHYCAMGNQPRVTAAAKVMKGKLDFACDGNPGNTDSHDDAHIHGWSMSLGDDGKLHISASMVQAGKVMETPKIVLTRQAATARR